MSIQFKKCNKRWYRLKFHNCIALYVMPCLILTNLPQMQKLTVYLWDFRLVILPFLNKNSFLKTQDSFFKIRFYSDWPFVMICLDESIKKFKMSENAFNVWKCLKMATNVWDVLKCLFKMSKNVESVFLKCLKM